MVVLVEVPVEVGEEAAAGLLMQSMLCLIGLTGLGVVRTLFQLGFQIFVKAEFSHYRIQVMGVRIEVVR